MKKIKMHLKNYFNFKINKIIIIIIKDGFGFYFLCFHQLKKIIYIIIILLIFVSHHNPIISPINKIKLYIIILY